MYKLSKQRDIHKHTNTSFSESPDIDMALCTEPLNRPNKNESMSCILEGEVYPPSTKHIWVGDSWLSCHLDNDDSGIYDVMIINDITGMIDRKTLVRTTKMKHKR